MPTIAMLPPRQVLKDINMSAIRDRSSTVILRRWASLRSAHPTRYARILERRAGTELVLGYKFDHLAFNNFLLDQGMLPPDLLAKAVREQFVPEQLAKR
jgi:hypothetical protein